MRSTVLDFANSRAAQALGYCNTDIPAICSVLNEATERLLNCFGETGPYGCWDKVVFNVNRTTPYLTLGARYARAANMDACRFPLRVSNEWQEVLFEGVGLQTQCAGDRGCGAESAYDRGNVATAFDMPVGASYLRIYLTNARDVGKQVIFSGAIDASGNGIYSTSGYNRVDGFPLILQTPFATSAFTVTSFAGIEKPVTYGDIVLRAVDPNTGVETFLSRYTPQETNPWYRRYYLHNLPNGCCACPTNPCQVQVTAMLKLEYRPICQPTDVLIIGCSPALKEECMAVRFSEMDSTNGAQLAELHHRKAVKLLNQQLVHYLGAEQPAIVVQPYQSIGLGRGGLNLQMM